VQRVVFIRGQWGGVEKLKKILRSDVLEGTKF
jgi:hypothetical protein